MESRPPVPLLEEFCAWSRAELEETESWRDTLSESEIEALAENVHRLARPRSDVAPLQTADALPPPLRSRLPGLSDALVFGRGFFVLRRLPLERLSQAEAEQLFRSLAAHFGRVRAEPKVGEMPSCEGYAFAATEGDVLAQLCIARAARGRRLAACQRGRAPQRDGALPPRSLAPSSMHRSARRGRSSASTASTSMRISMPILPRLRRKAARRT